MDIDAYMSDLKNLIERALIRYLPSEKNAPRIIHKAMRYSVFSQGKRLRPILAIESCKTCGGRPSDVLPAACAIELIHTYSLVHDDLPSMDDDDYRRGRPSCHKAFGEANAILTGDGLLTLAFNIISKDMNSKICSKVIRELSDAIGTDGMVGGQAVDLEFKNNKIIKADTLNNINYLKTARLFEASTKIGAVAASASAKKIKLMARYGASLGRAFQIVDDIIDQEGHAELFGKGKAAKDAANLIKKAKDLLRIFGKKADTLKEIADTVLERIA